MGRRQGCCRSRRKKGSVRSGPLSRGVGPLDGRDRLMRHAVTYVGYIRVYRGFLLYLSLELKRYGAGNQEAWLLDLTLLLSICVALDE